MTVREGNRLGTLSLQGRIDTASEGARRLPAVSGRELAEKTLHSVNEPDAGRNSYWLAVQRAAK